ncbi:MAG TPA: hypothetical protein VJ866_22785 [Pyrinomonadaceae bacterium]|nr:hypothetical protein [Pyrinomonadaceae bacterium]
MKSMLFTAEGRDFERTALPFIRAIWADAIVPQPLRSTFDRSGVDILTWSGADAVSISLAVQCKGFAVREHELGDDQIRQCLKSIEDFRKSGIRADTYLLLHNRIPSNDRFREEVFRAADELRESGLAREAYVWGPQRLIQEAVKRVRERCARILQLNEERVSEFQLEPPLCDPVERVPMRISEIKVSPNQKLGEKELEEVVADPAEELLRTARSNLSVMLANAGYGKTTSALRTVSASRRVFYLSAATLPPGVKNTHSLLERWVRLDKLFEDAQPEDVSVLEELAGRAIIGVLKDAETPVILILDALDESIYFSRKGGLQLLFNQLRDIQIPVVLLARSEFWEGKQKDFASSYDLLARHKDRTHNRRVTIIRLTDWGREQIETLARRFADTQAGPARGNLEELIELVRSGGYEEIYGDIPKRPLFLRFILESVAEQGIRRKGRARLFYEWVELKILRDILNPLNLGGEGRQPIVENADGTEATVRLAFRAMKAAALEMTTRPARGNSLELLPSCDVEDVLLSDRRLEAVLDPTGLFLHSLLVPVRSTPERLEIGFAHRAYQEFFLALCIRDDPGRFSGVDLPTGVRDFMNDIRAERL